MSEHDDVPDLHRRLPWWLARPSPDLLFIAYARVYAAATVLRLTLPDAVQSSWLPVTIVQGLGALVLAATGGLLGWLLCAIGALGGILFLEDQLTQSAYLLACALAAIGCFAGPARGRAERVGQGVVRAVAVLTLLVYLLAGFHKLNADFLDPAVSCANAGLRALVSHGRDTPLAGESFWSARAWPPLFLAVELALPWVALWRPRPAVVLMAAFHLPLTIIFAPSFAVTMMSGWVCLLGEPGLRALGETFRARYRVVLVAGLVPAVASALTFFPYRLRSDPDWRVKEALLWCVLVALVATWWRHREAFSKRDVWVSATKAASRHTRAVTVVVGVAFAFHGLTPYLGLGFHRTGAMLSNLRIDRGCHNHLLIPPSVQLVDPYLSVENIRFAPDRAAPGFDHEVEGRLWSFAALWRARTHWCSKHPEPLAITVHHEGRRHDIADFCAREGWPWPEPWLVHMRRFQVNLTGRCPQPCIH